MRVANETGVCVFANVLAILDFNSLAWNRIENVARDFFIPVIFLQQNNEIQGSREINRSYIAIYESIINKNLFPIRLRFACFVFFYSVIGLFVSLSPSFNFIFLRFVLLRGWKSFMRLFSIDLNKSSIERKSEEDKFENEIGRFLGHRIAFQDDISCDQQDERDSV